MFDKAYENLMTELEFRARGQYQLGGINPNDDEYASKTYAQLIRSQYADYQERFQPYEERMMDLATSRELLDQQLSRIGTNINASFANPQFSAGALASQRYGTQQTAQERSFNTRQSDMDRALATANAKNNMRLANADMKQNMVTGGTSVRGLVTG